MSTPTAIAAALVVALSIGESATAVSYGFEHLAHGEIANGSFDGVTISANNPWRWVDYAVGFDSRAHETLGSTADPDLQAGSGSNPWSGGNIAAYELGTMLILQENGKGCWSGVCSRPDDEGRRPAGQIAFDFAVPVVDFGFDAVDIESIMAENASIDFIGGGITRSIDLMSFFDSTHALYDASLMLGDNTANRFTPITVEFLDMSVIERVEFNLGGSGALDNLEYTSVPEPGSALMLVVGLMGLVARRRHTT